MGKLPAEGGGKGPGRRLGSRKESRLGSRALPTRGGIGLGSPPTSLTASDEKTRRNSRQHISKGGSMVQATPSLGESNEPFHAVKSLFKPYQVGGCLRPSVGFSSSHGCGFCTWKIIVSRCMHVALTYDTLLFRMVKTWSKSILTVGISHAVHVIGHLGDVS